MVKTENKEAKTEYVTIGKFFHEFLENKECRVLKFVLDGNSYGANHRTKRNARVSIMLPPEICDTNLKDLDNWIFNIIAIPRKVVFPEEEQKGDEKNNVKNRK